MPHVAIFVVVVVVIVVVVDEIQIFARVRAVPALDVVAAVAVQHVQGGHLPRVLRVELLELAQAAHALVDVLAGVFEDHGAVAGHLLGGQFFHGRDGETCRAHAFVPRAHEKKEISSRVPGKAQHGVVGLARGMEFVGDGGDFFLERLGRPVDFGSDGVEFRQDELQVLRFVDGGGEELPGLAAQESLPVVELDEEAGGDFGDGVQTPERLRLVEVEVDGEGASNVDPVGFDGFVGEAGGEISTAEIEARVLEVAGAPVGVELGLSVVEAHFEKFSEGVFPGVLRNIDQRRHDGIAVFAKGPSGDGTLRPFVRLVRRLLVPIFFLGRGGKGVRHILHRDIDLSVVVNEGQGMFQDRFFAAGVLTLERQIEAAVA
mmetsp:Transcript_22048/g.50344  ORF Transcript_22048/g.50344 Transcript_22048/m.50344 type:complete len:374 (-) Transcript_22048:477-1598(-)